MNSPVQSRNKQSVEKQQLAVPDINLELAVNITCHFQRGIQYHLSPTLAHIVSIQKQLPSFLPEGCCITKLYSDTQDGSKNQPTNQPKKPPSNTSALQLLTQKL